MSQQPSNPFLLVGYESPAYFCNRETETQKLLEAVANERNVTLYSIRRMGKTALIKHLFGQLQKQGSVTTLYVDLMPTNNFDELTRRLAEAIIDRYSNFRQGLSKRLQTLLANIGASIGFDPMTGMPEVSLQLREPRQIEYSLTTLFTFLEEQDEQIVLAFDEFQQVASYPTTRSEAMLRNLVQEYNRIRFLFSGSHIGVMSSMFSDQGRAFYRTTQILNLKPIDSESYRSFIRHHFEKARKTIPDDVIDLLLTWCKRQTYYVQLLCNRLYARYDNVDRDALAIVWQEVLDEEQAVFHNYKNLLTKTQWHILIAIAKDEPIRNVTATRFLQNHRLGAASTVAGAIKSLSDKQLIAYSEDGYFVQDALLSRWLQLAH